MLEIRGTAGVVAVGNGKTATFNFKDCEAGRYAKKQWAILNEPLPKGELKLANVKRGGNND